MLNHHIKYMQYCQISNYFPTFDCLWYCIVVPIFYEMLCKLFITCLLLISRVLNFALIMLVKGWPVLKNSLISINIENEIITLSEMLNKPMKTMLLMLSGLIFQINSLLITNHFYRVYKKTQHLIFKLRKFVVPL
jgi:hypothetical protein